MAKRLGTDTVETVDPASVTIVGLDTEANADDPLYDERVNLPLDESMVLNIMALGVLNPVSVARDGDNLFVVDGRQRVRATREAAKRQQALGEIPTMLPVIEVKGNDNRLASVMISTNEIRRSDETLTRAYKASRLMDRLRDAEQVAVLFGVSPQTIRNWGRVTDAIQEIQDAVRDELITFTDGMNLGSLDRSEQKAELDKLLALLAKKNKGEKKPKAVERKEQLGVKKSWLKRAVKSFTFRRLPEEHQAVLAWFLQGAVKEGHWIFDFVQDYENEKENGAEEQPEDSAEVID